MKKSLISALGAVLLGAISGCVNNRCRIDAAELAPGVPEYTLANEIIAVKCVPAVSGLLSGFSYLPENRQMIKPLHYLGIDDDLLPRRQELSKTGLRELAWGNGLRSVYSSLDILCAKGDAKSVQLVLSGRYFQNEDVAIVKTISLRRGEALVRNHVRLTRKGGRVLSPKFWLNFIAELGKTQDTVLLPVRGNVSQWNGRAALRFARDGVYADNRMTHQQVYAAPARPWIARVSAERSGVLVLRFNDAFYHAGNLLSWKHATDTLHTMEMIFPAMELKLHQSQDYSYDCIYFHHLRGLRDLAGHYGIDRRGNCVEIAVSAPVAAGELVWRYVDRMGKIHTADRAELPPMSPGEIVKLSIPNNIPAEAVSIGGILPGNNRFNLYDLVEPL